jgi:putative colanic acid biosynthesis acetyltransferase WcaF
MFIYGLRGELKGLIVFMSEDSKRIRNDLFSNPEFSRGASRQKEVCWMILSGTLVESWLPGSWWRRILLRAFGASVGKGVSVKPGVRIKFPWRLKLGDYAWLGESVWIDNLSEVTIDSHTCLSQGAYLCTGSHDWTDRKFKLITKPIIVEHGCWIGANVSIAPGAILGTGSVITMGSVASGKLKPWTVYAGVPAKAIRQRNINSDS